MRCTEAVPKLIAPFAGIPPHFRLHAPPNPTPNHEADIQAYFQIKGPRPNMANCDAQWWHQDLGQERGLTSTLGTRDRRSYFISIGIEWRPLSHRRSHS